MLYPVMPPRVEELACNDQAFPSVPTGYPFASQLQLRDSDIPVLHRFQRLVLELMPQKELNVSFPRNSVCMAHTHTSLAQFIFCVFYLSN